jgi:hypothetical protein
MDNRLDKLDKLEHLEKLDKLDKLDKLEKIDKIVDIIDIVKDDLVEIKVTMAKNTASLDTHIRRTDLAEENIKFTREEIGYLKSQMVEEFKPVKSHIAFVKGAMWAMGIAGAVVLGLNELGVFKVLFH